MDDNSKNNEGGERDDPLRWMRANNRLYPAQFGAGHKEQPNEPEIWQIYQVEPEDRDLFVRFCQAKAIEKQSKEYPTGLSIIFTGLLYMLYDFLMNHYNSGL